ncbi:MAG: prolyl oligopeptidase family serine peptidase [Nitrospirota bacterium]
MYRGDMPMLAVTLLRRWVPLATIVALLAGCQFPRQWAAPSPDALAAARAYLAADDAAAERMVPTLATRPVDDLENALHRAIIAPDRAVGPVGKQPGRRFQVGNRTFHYALYVPESYRAEHAYPLVICLHGAGFGGETYLDRWQPRLKEGFILACPTIKDAAWWTKHAEELVMAVLAEVSRLYWIDPDRVMLTGMSNGGTGVFVIGLNHADRFAALVPMASALPRGLYPLLDNARHTRFYVIHGARDEVMPVKYSRDLVSYLQKNGFQVVYREHEKEHPMAGGHFFPQEELPDLVGWLSVRSRLPVPDKLTVVRDRDHAGRLYWLRIDESRGAASFWASEFDKEESRRLQEGAWARVDAQIKKNTIAVRTERVARYTLLLGRDQVDFSRSVTVLTNGTVSFEGRITPDASVLLREARRTPDPERFVLAEVPIAVPP